MSSQGEVGALTPTWCGLTASPRPPGRSADDADRADARIILQHLPKDMLADSIERDYIRHHVGALQARLTAMP
jgi:hypothetical protein